MLFFSFSSDRWRTSLLGVSLLLAPCVSAVAATLRVPEDHASIQAAIDAASSGDTVLVSAGTYRERVKLRPGVVLRSAGGDERGKLGLARAERTIIDGRDQEPGADGSVPGVEMAERAVLDGFTITGVGKYDDKEWQRHFATRGEEQSYEMIGRIRQPGILVPGVTCVVESNIVHHVGDNGVEIRGEPGKRCAPRVVRNVAYRNMGGGIGSTGGSSAVIEENTCFENFYAGIGQDGASPILIANVCYGNIRAGIGIGDGAQPIVRGNKCYGNRRAGIGIRSGPKHRPIVEDNECRENGMAGIGVRNGSRPLLVSNQCIKNRLAGIGSREDSRPVIVSNECAQNEKAGIGFEASKTGRATLVENRVIDNALVAVGVQRGWNVLLSDNELSRKGGMPPIIMVFEGAKADLRGNVIRGGGVAGVRAAGVVRAIGTRFEGTRKAKGRGGPPNFAVWALEGADVAVLGCVFQGWRQDISAQKARVTKLDNQLQPPAARGIK